MPLEIVVKKETKGKADMIPDEVMSFVQAGFRSRLPGEQIEGKPRANSCPLTIYKIILSLPERSIPGSGQVKLSQHGIMLITTKIIFICLSFSLKHKRKGCFFQPFLCKKKKFYIFVVIM